MTTKPEYLLFDRHTTAIIYGLQRASIQRMLDFDALCRRETPSVAAIVNPTGNGGFHRAFFGTQEILIPITKTIAEATTLRPQADVLINFASFRSAFATTMEALEQASLRTVAVIAEGIPERQARIMAARARAAGKVIIGPATVGGLAAGAFKIGNTGGTSDNIVASKLYRPGSVGYVGKSGGLTNETFNIIARNADGVFEGVAIGGDAYPGSRLLDHLLRYRSIKLVNRPAKDRNTHQRFAPHCINITDRICSSDTAKSERIINDGHEKICCAEYRSTVAKVKRRRIIVSGIADEQFRIFNHLTGTF